MYEEFITVLVDNCGVRYYSTEDISNYLYCDWLLWVKYLDDLQLSVCYHFDKNYDLRWFCTQVILNKFLTDNNFDINDVDFIYNLSQIPNAIMVPHAVTSEIIKLYDVNGNVWCKFRDIISLLKLDNEFAELVPGQYVRPMSDLVTDHIFLSGTVVYTPFIVDTDDFDEDFVNFNGARELLPFAADLINPDNLLQRFYEKTLSVT